MKRVLFLLISISFVLLLASCSPKESIEELKDIEDEKKLKEYITLYAEDKDILFLGDILCKSLKNVIDKKLDYLCGVVSGDEKLIPQFFYLIY